MISLTRLSGTQFLLNADLIERVDSTPDTVITLVDGTKYVVSESLGAVLDAVIAYRGEIVALGSLLDSAHSYAQSVSRLPEPRRTDPRAEAKLAAVTPHPSAERPIADQSSGEAR